MNYILVNEHRDGDLEDSLFGEPVEHLEPNLDMYDVLVRAGVFSSKGQARKNWKQTGPSVPPGFNMWTVGKTRKILAIWLPISTST